MTNLIFVYGTLRRDYGGAMYNSLIKPHATFIGYATMQAALYKVAHFPGLIPSDNPKCQVLGEVYELHNTKKSLPALDAYEGYHPNDKKYSLYIREVMPATFENGETVDVNVYVYNHDVTRFSPIVSGDFCHD